MSVEEFAESIGRARAALPGGTRTLAGACRFYAPTAAVEIVGGRVQVTASRGVLTLRRESTAAPWTMRVALDGVAWPDDGDAPTDEPSLVAALAAVTGCPSSALESTAASLRWLGSLGADVGDEPEPHETDMCCVCDGEGDVTEGHTTWTCTGCGGCGYKSAAPLRR